MLVVKVILFFHAFLPQDEGEDSEVEGDNEEKITRNWSVLKSNPELQKSKVIFLKFKIDLCMSVNWLS